MKKIQLGGHINGSKIRGYTIVDGEDFEFLNKWKWYRKEGYVARKEHVGEVSGKYTGKLIYMHQFIINPPKGMQTDHRNRNKLDNRRENIRICSQSENKQNRGKLKNNTSGFIGVTPIKENNKWIARMYHQVNGVKKRHIGTFNSKEEAAIAYNKVAVKYRGEFAVLNIISI